MTRELIGFLMLTGVAVIALLIWRSTRKKRALQETFIAKPLPATGSGGFSALYVSTVFEHQPLDRIWAHGLAMRGNAELRVDDSGVSVVRTGEVGFLIPTQQLAGLEAASATIDKGVERDGLTAIFWKLGNTEVISHFRFTSPGARKDFEKEVSLLIGAQIG
ncbi:MAG: hypothetical protein RLZ99_127 [Actinomycetota bacterium]|jgi:hypothetical protein